jgi:hypothetical protein
MYPVALGMAGGEPFDVDGQDDGRSEQPSLDDLDDFAYSMIDKSSVTGGS